MQHKKQPQHTFSIARRNFLVGVSAIAVTSCSLPTDRAKQTLSDLMKSIFGEHCANTAELSSFIHEFYEIRLTNNEQTALHIIPYIEWIQDNRTERERSVVDLKNGIISKLATDFIRGSSFQYDGEVPVKYLKLVRYDEYGCFNAISSKAPPEITT